MSKGLLHHTSYPHLCSASREWDRTSPSSTMGRERPFWRQPCSPFSFGSGVWLPSNWNNNRMDRLGSMIICGKISNQPNWEVRTVFPRAHLPVTNTSFSHFKTKTCCANKLTGESEDPEHAMLKLCMCVGFNTKSLKISRRDLTQVLSKAVTIR